MRLHRIGYFALAIFYIPIAAAELVYDTFHDLLRLILPADVDGLARELRRHERADFVEPQRVAWLDRFQSAGSGAMKLLTLERRRMGTALGAT